LSAEACVTSAVPASFAVAATVGISLYDVTSYVYVLPSIADSILVSPMMREVSLGADDALVITISVRFPYVLLIFAPR